jgi:hypothetical protein
MMAICNRDLHRTEDKLDDSGNNHPFDTRIDYTLDLLFPSRLALGTVGGHILTSRECIAGGSCPSLISSP